MLKLLLDWLFNRNCDACGSWRGLYRTGERTLTLESDPPGTPRRVTRRDYTCRNCGVHRQIDRPARP